MIGNIWLGRRVLNIDVVWLCRLYLYLCLSVIWVVGGHTSLLPAFLSLKSIKAGDASLIQSMALDLLRSAKSILKIDDLTIDNIVFKLHYRVTVAILVGSSLVGVAKQYFGDPISKASCGLLSTLRLIFFNRLSDQLRSVQRGAGWLLLDPLHIPREVWVPGDSGLLGGPRAGGGEPVQVQRSRVLPPAEQPPGEQGDSGHQLLPVGPLHTHPPGNTHTTPPSNALSQASLFYLPRKIWKTFEGGLMASFGTISFYS